eukprot:13828718-Ditylum_brightwellii.AAC.1
MRTVPIIRQVLHYKVGQWCKLLCNNFPQIPSNATGDVLCTAVEFQADIDWDNFIKGRVSKHWYHTQACYINALPQCKAFDSAL